MITVEGAQFTVGGVVFTYCHLHNNKFKLNKKNPIIIAFKSCKICLSYLYFEFFSFF